MVYCNPLNLTYRYQHFGKAAHREAADPTLVLFKGKYYLFASMCAGFYVSEDLFHWEFHENLSLDMYRYAPDVHEIDGKLVFCASTRGENSTFWRTDDPLPGKFEKIPAQMEFWDPALFQDEDGKVYLYWGCDCGKPIYGVELDRKTLAPMGKPAELIFGAETEHGWERRAYPGMVKTTETFTMKLLYFMMELSGRKKEAPFIEGAFMNKWNGKYYLQYAAPATEIATYGDGVYVGSSPLGPFSYQAHNPVSFKPGGFICGAGHGSTIADKYGNLWHAASMGISVNANFERRVGIFPAGLDTDGTLFCNQNYADYPLEIPEGRFDPWQVQPKWMLLSFHKGASASSSVENHEPELALDENIRTCWCAAGSAGEWFELDLGKDYDVRAVQINFADVDVPVIKVPKSLRSNMATNRRFIDYQSKLRTRWLLEGSADGKTWRPLADKRAAETDLPHDLILLDGGQRLRYLRITAAELPYGKKFALSGFRVFGAAEGAKPEAVREIRVEAPDAMTAALHWENAPNATGYNIRYGIAPEKLYLSHMVYSNQALLTGLNRGQPYWYCIDSIGEGGITPGRVQKLPDRI